jgi:hypothetical protein
VPLFLCRTRGRKSGKYTMKEVLPQSSQKGLKKKVSVYSHPLSMSIYSYFC